MIEARICEPTFPVAHGCHKVPERLSSMPHVACLLLQKNERSLLEPWILYHASLFGLANLFVFDNGSDDPVVKAILSGYEAQGMFVDRTYYRPDDYPFKGDILSRKIHELQAHVPQYELYIPLDCDEFVALEQEGEVTFEPGRILAYLNELREKTAIYHVSVNYANQLGFPEYFRRWGYNKIFMGRHYVRSLDHGSHLPLRHDYKVIECNVVYFHCHYKPFRILVEHSREKLRPFVDVDDISALDQLVADNGHGKHLVRYLKMAEHEYLGEFSPQGAMHIPGFADRLLGIGADTAFLRGTDRFPGADMAADSVDSPAGTDIGYGSGAFAVRQRSALRPGSPQTFIIPVVSSVSAEFVRIALVGSGVAASGDVSESCHHDDALVMALESGDLMRLRRLLAKRNQDAPTWAAFLPPSTVADYSLIREFRRPALIWLLRDPADAAQRPGSAFPEFVADSFISTTVQNVNAFGAVLQNELPNIVFFFDRSIQSVDSFLDSLLRYCNLQPTPRERGDTVMSLHRYVDSLQPPGAIIYEGWVDHAYKGVVSGWCRCLRSNVPVTLELFVNGRKIDATVANIHRPDLQAGGIGTGRYAFVFRVENAIAADCRDVAVLVAGNGFALRQTDNAQQTLATGAFKPDTTKITTSA